MQNQYSRGHYFLNISVLSLLILAWGYYAGEKSKDFNKKKHISSTVSHFENLPIMYESSANMMMFTGALPDTVTIVRTATSANLTATACGGTGGLGSPAWTPNTGIPLFNFNGFNDINSSNNVYASYTRGSPGHSRCLELTGYDFNIPTGATILGLKLSIERNGQTTGSAVEDSLIQLMNPSSGTVQNKEAGFWPITDAVQDYGSASDLWGASWTSASVSAPGFGARIKLEFATAGTANIDSVSISVTYVVPPKQGVARNVSTNGNTGTCVPTGATTWQNANAGTLGANDGTSLLGVAISGYATATLPISLAANRDTTDCLQLRDFGFNISPFAIVDSINVLIERGRTALGTDTATDIKIALVNPTTLMETQNKANLGVNWPTVDGIAIYGHDNWNHDWTPAEINDPLFGLNIQAYIAKAGLNLTTQARIDEVSVQVFCHYDTLLISKNLEGVMVDKSNPGLTLTQVKFSMVACNASPTDTLKNVQLTDTIKIFNTDCGGAIGSSVGGMANLSGSLGSLMNGNRIINITGMLPPCTCDTLLFSVLTQGQVLIDTSNYFVGTAEVGNTGRIVSDSSNNGTTPFTDSTSPTPVYFPQISVVKWVDTIARALLSEGPISCNYDITYFTKIVNTGSIALCNVVLIDSLASPTNLGSAYNGLVFGPTIEYGASFIPGGLALFDGFLSDSILNLASMVCIPPGDSIIISFIAQVNATAPGAPPLLNNQSQVSALDTIFNNIVCDRSDDGRDPLTNNGAGACDDHTLARLVVLGDTLVISKNLDSIVAHKGIDFLNNPVNYTSTHFSFYICNASPTDTLYNVIVTDSMTYKGGCNNFGYEVHTSGDIDSNYTLVKDIEGGTILSTSGTGSGGASVSGFNNLYTQTGIRTLFRIDSLLPCTCDTVLFEFSSGLPNLDTANFAVATAFVGSAFINTVSDTSNDGTLPITDSMSITPFYVPGIAVAKWVDTSTLNIPPDSVGNFEVIYNTKIVNTGNTVLCDIKLDDTLDLAYRLGTAYMNPPAAVVTLVSGIALTINAGYNGLSAGVPEVLTPSPTVCLNPGDSTVISIKIMVNPNASGAPDSLYNQASVSARDTVNKTTLCDFSDEGENVFTDNGAGNCDDPTRLRLVDINISKQILSIAPYNQALFPGDAAVEFQLLIKNKGNVPIYDLMLTDSIIPLLGTSFKVIITPPYLVSPPKMINGAVTSVNQAANPPSINNFPKIIDGSMEIDTIKRDEFLDIRYVLLIDPNDPAALAGIMNTAYVMGNSMIGETSDSTDTGFDPESRNLGERGDTGGEEDPTRIEIPMINIAKNLDKVRKPLSGTKGNFEAIYTINIENTGNISLDSVLVKDSLAGDLGAYFVKVVELSLISTDATIAPQINPAYNGKTDINLLLPATGENLEPGQTISLKLIVEIDPIIGDMCADTLYNSALAYGYGIDGTTGDPILDAYNNQVFAYDTSDAGLIPEDFNASNFAHKGTANDPTAIPPGWKDVPKCHDLLHISVDGNCEHLLTPGDLLAGTPKLFIDLCFYEIKSIKNSLGQDIPNPIPGLPNLGYKLTATVENIVTCTNCWSDLKLEDKSPAGGGDIIDTLTCFEVANLPHGEYTIADNCYGDSKVSVISEKFDDYGCDSASVQGKVTRVLLASDVWKNSSRFTQTIYIEKLHLDSIVCPRDTAVDCALEVIEMTIKGVKTKVSILDPIRSKGPMVKTKDGLKPIFGAGGACKLNSIFKDERHNVCGNSYKILRTWLIVDWCTGKEKECKQWIEVIDTTAPVPTNVSLPVFISDPHDCGAYINLDTLKVADCNRVNQRYNLVYSLEGKEYVVQGKLPDQKIWVPVGSYRINVLLVDACKNNNKGYIDITVVDKTPPTPICDEFTQVTVDPLTCWTSVAAKDLDNGSRDNCCEVLHFAAAHMDSIEYWRKYWGEKLEAEAGNEEYWQKKHLYDAMIEEWINHYVFSDTVHFDECGPNQVVLRVYDACGIPRMDPHLWPCSPHAWFCYNTSFFQSDFNYNWFNANGAKSCKYRPALTTLSKIKAKYSNYQTNGYLQSKFYGGVDVYWLEDEYGWLSYAPYNLRTKYNDCMVQVLVDDKQAPVVAGLEDITVYCDGADGLFSGINAPGTKNAESTDCGYGDEYTSSTWPLAIKDARGSTVNYINSAYGYYGGSSFLGIHFAAGDHEDPQACEQNKGWAPIYCRSWLLLDSTDEAGKRDYTKLFDKLLLFDKGRKQTADLKKSEFSITDNCRLNDTSLKVENAGTVNSCGEGWLSRTWTIEDKCGNKVSATQKIYIKKRSDFEVIFPEDKVVTCDFLNRTDTSTKGAGRPVISDDECEQVGMQYKDEIFTVTDSACYKIVRTWTIIDWCTYDPNQHDHHPDVIVDDRLRADSSARSCVYRHIKDNNDGFMRYIQIIKVIDEIAPVVTCSDQTVCIDAACSTTVNIPLVGSDNCADEVVLRVEITKPDGSKEIRANIKAITGTVVEGIYTYQIIGKDRCGNEDTCTMKLTVKDCKKPTPYCYDGLATVIMPSRDFGTGTIEVWAKDFNVASEDNCTAKGDLKYSFSKDVTQASKVFTCADIKDGKLQGLIVEMWVTDKAGNQDLCKVSLQLQDNSSSQYPTGACKDTTASVAGVTGRLVTEENEGVEKVNVEIVPTSAPSQALSYSSKVDGSYAFNDMAVTSASYTLKAKRDDEPMNGVSTIDLVLIQKHILGTESLKTPYKMIAADANNDKDNTAVDLVELRKLILGVYDKLPNNTSWKFVPKSYVFTDVLNPWSYPTEEKLTEMKGNMTKDFVGIKVGDVNASSIPHSLMGTEVRSTETGLILEVEDQTFKAGDKVEVSFRSPNFAGVSGFQGTISASYLKPHTSYLTPGKLGITDKNFGTRWANEGLVTMSWNTNTGIDINTEEVLFTMTFVAQKAGVLSEVMHIGSQRTKAESYEGKGELGNLAIRFTKNGKEVSGSNTLYQNYPNPFDQRTVIGLNLAKLVNGTLKITDVTGKVVKEINREWNKGYNEVLLSKGEIKSKGILFYSFESNEFNATKRMIVIE